MANTEDRKLLHDIRNSINSVVMIGRCLQQPVDDEQRAHLGELMERGAEETRELLQRIEERLSDRTG